MPRASKPPKPTSFHMRIDPALKEAFAKATEAEDRPAAQVVRSFMRAYVNQRERRAFESEARRQSREAAALAHDPHSDEYVVMREIEAELADETFWNAD